VAAEASRVTERSMNFIKHTKLLFLTAIVIMAFVATVFIRGVYYWYSVLPPEDSVLMVKGVDIFSERRIPVDVNGKSQLYSESFSPLLLAALKLPAIGCVIERAHNIWLEGSMPTVRYLRSKGQNIGFCSRDADDKGCWPMDALLVSAAAKLKYSRKVQTELYLMSLGWPQLGVACKEIVGHSCREVSPEEAVVVSAWVKSPQTVWQRLQLEKVLKEAEKLAKACNQSYSPATHMRLVPPLGNEELRIRKVIFTYKPAVSSGAGAMGQVKHY